jgi:two-component system osmolarity sensor histidine kinase EnvZ|tara:strand:- start:600 stop:1196 length:597 start_codon:yes stop_codon:yes gene_type:complete
MLSGISHDLRTPLTRIKLQLAFIKDKEIEKKLSDDVIEMEKMLNEYLQFSSNRSNEKSENFDISDLVSKTVSKYETKKIFFEKKSEILFIGRKNLIKRSLSNFIDNALKYSDKVVIDIKKSANNIVINIDDNGIGIPEKERENVFKPFYKIDKSRGDSKSSVGLGMSIASDMIQSHGGSIKLENSSLGGLRVKIFLPF